VTVAIQGRPVKIGNFGKTHASLRDVVVESVLDVNPRIAGVYDQNKAAYDLNHFVKIMESFTTPTKAQEEMQVPSIGLVLKSRRDEQSARNEGPREAVSKCAADSNLPNGPQGMVKIQKLAWLYEYAKDFALAEMDVYGVLPSSFKHACVGAPQQMVHYNEKAVEGSKVGRIEDVTDDEGVGRNLIDCSAMSEKSIKEKTTGQYEKLAHIVRAKYDNVIVRLELAAIDACPIDTHPVYTLYKMYETVKLVKVGRLNSLEFFAICSKRVKVVPAYNAQHFVQFSKRNAMVIYYANKQMSLMTAYGLSLPISSKIAPLLRGPIPKREFVVSCGVRQPGERNSRNDPTESDLKEMAMDDTIFF